jgi:hypothetical protein
MQNDRLNWTVPSIKKISNEKKKMEGATNQFPRHTRALNQFITMLSSRSSFLLSVGDLSQKKKNPVGLLVIIIIIIKRNQVA